MDINSGTRGFFRLCKLSLWFAFTTLAACLVGRIALSAIPHNPWNTPIGTNATWIGPLATFVFALTAFLHYGSTNSAAENPEADLKETFWGLMTWHLIYVTAFVAPQILMAYDGKYNPICYCISFLCFFPMVGVCQHVDRVVAQKAESSNSNAFLRSIGNSGKTTKTKGIRRD